MIVMKFGGTSVEDAASVERVTQIIRERLELRPVVVVSAMGKTTRKLLQAAEHSASGDNRTTLGIVADLKARHTSEARRLIAASNARETFALIDRYFDELKKLLEGLAILGEVPPRGLDKILSYGELLSSAIVAGAISERGVRARLLDSREFIKTDNRFGEASPLFDITNELIQESIAPVIEADEVAVIQGFIGSTRTGATTTLGFEGSDYTAAIVGAAMEAEDIQIWKDVSGLMTADPAVFAGARTVKVCSFAEAGELTYFGAKVLHPKAIYPAARKDIPVHIYNSKRPADAGTAISAAVPACANLIKSIAYKRPVSVISAAYETGPEQMLAVAPDDFLRSLFDVLGRRRIRPLLTSVSASRAALAVDSNALNDSVIRDLIEELSRFATASIEQGKAIVSLVGQELTSDSTLTGRVFKAIEQIRLGVIMHGSSPISMSFIVADSDVETVIAGLHEIFFDRLDPQVFE